MRTGQTGRLEQAGLTAIVLIHLIVSVIHGRAHAGAQVLLPLAGNLFVYIVIVAAPLLGLALSFWRPLAGAAVVGVAMAGSLVFGLINHFIILGSDHVTHVAPEWRTLFTVTAALLALIEATGAAVGIRLATRLRRAS
jgi:hypothetical protein